MVRAILSGMWSATRSSRPHGDSPPPLSLSAERRPVSRTRHVAASTELPLSEAVGVVEVTATLADEAWPEASSRVVRGGAPPTAGRRVGVDRSPVCPRTRSSVRGQAGQSECPPSRGSFLAGVLSKLEACEAFSCAASSALPRHLLVEDHPRRA